MYEMLARVDIACPFVDVGLASTADWLVRVFVSVPVREHDVFPRCKRSHRDVMVVATD